MISDSPPQGFSPIFHVVSCFCEHEGKILLLKRQDHKPEGNRWGVPAGKIDPGESPDDAMIRELNEETGIIGKPRYFTKVFVRYPEYDFVFYIYHLLLDRSPIVKIDRKEHKDFQWVTPADSLKADLVKDFDACVRLFYKIPA